MQEHVLKYVHVPYDHAIGDLPEGEAAIALAKDIVARFEVGEKLYFRFNVGDRKGSIAYLKKLDTKNNRIDKHQRRGIGGPQVQYTLWLKGTVCWDDRKNTAKVDLYTNNGQITFLDGYEGGTVWEKDDVKAEAAAIKAATKVLDMRGNEIKERDIVVFINSRYGSGSCLDYGIIEAIEVKVRHTTWNNKKETVITTVIRNTRTDADGKDILSKVKNPEHFILVITDTDLAADAAASKLLNS